MADPKTPTPAPERAPAVRSFGRMRLLRLLGKSERTMAWRVDDPRTGQELMLVLPRVQPPDDAALERWLEGVRRASRLSHPNLAAAIEIGVQDGWPFVAYDPLDSSTLAERVPERGLPGAELAPIAVQLLQGLAFAHDAGLAHEDLQPYHLLIGDTGPARLAGLAVAAELLAPPGAEAAALRTQRAAAERDVLAAGVIMHGALVGAGEVRGQDVGRLIQRLPPLGPEMLRLPWATGHAIAEPLRAIVNRATDRQERRRYRNARTLLRALDGWLQIESDAGGGPLAQLAERLRSGGVLPSSPGAAARAARLALMERQRTSELAEVVLEDLALSFELLRLVNSAQVRGMQVSGSGPVLTVRRAIAMVGLDSVRRAALALREWPGPLQPADARQLGLLIERCKRAGRAAVLLRPAGYDGEVVYLITLLQSLGRLALHYHFPDEAEQIHRLQQPAPSSQAGEPDEPGMSEGAAAHAVLGADVEALAAVVARHCGLDAGALTMIRRHPLTTTVHDPEGDAELLRTVASCANEAVEAMAQPAARVQSALERVVLRYGRVLEIGLRELHAALNGQTAAVVAERPTAVLDAPPVPAARGGQLRAAAAARGRPGDPDAARGGGGQAAG